MADVPNKYYPSAITSKVLLAVGMLDAEARATEIGKVIRTAAPVSRGRLKKGIVTEVGVDRGKPLAAVRVTGAAQYYAHFSDQGTIYQAAQYWVSAGLRVGRGTSVYENGRLYRGRG